MYTHDPRTQYGRNLKDCPQCEETYEFDNGHYFGCCSKECEELRTQKVSENIYDLWSAIDWSIAHSSKLPRLIFDHALKLNDKEFTDQLIEEASANKYHIQY